MTKVFLKRICVSNFKSFRKIDLSLDKFNVVIGANASGKSNLVNVFRFLKDITNEGLDNAISMQGGIEFISNIGSGYGTEMAVEVEFEASEGDLRYELLKLSKAILAKKVVYSFKIGFVEEGQDYKVKQEKIHVEFDLEVTEKKIGGRETSWKKIREGKFSVSWDEAQKENWIFEPTDIRITPEDIFPLRSISEIYTKEREQSKERMKKNLRILSVRSQAMVTGFFSPLWLRCLALINSMAIFDIDPKLCKKSTAITGKTILESDGNNLAMVLRNILSDERQKKRFSALMSDLLPFVESLSVARLADNSMITFIKESHCKEKDFPAPMISDGTMNLAALIVALFFEESPFVIIEEPERNIHPHLISKIVGLMKEVSERNDRQIIITSHNPEVIKHGCLENLILIQREGDHSIITRPAEKVLVQEFLKNNLGIEDLFVQDLLR